jgi:hypothetical protein
VTGFVSIEMQGNDLEVLAMIAAVEKALDPVSVGEWLLTEFDPFLSQRAAYRFAEQGDDASGSWPELADYTVYDRINLGYGAGPIQVRTQDLEDYITETPGDIFITQAGARMVFPGSGATQANKLKYKVGSAQKGNVRTGAPPRPVLAANEVDLEYFLTQFSEHIIATGHGLGALI